MTKSEILETKLETVLLGSGGKDCLSVTAFGAQKVVMKGQPFHNQKGQALIELAVTLLMLLVILFGITEFGRYFYYATTFKSAARAGVRQAVVTPGLAAEPPGTTITTYVQSLLPSGLSPAPTVKVIIYSSSDTDCPPTPCACSRQSTASNGNRVEVRVCWDFTVVSGSILPFSSRTIVGDASMRYEL